jgi:hypothetical protein
MFSLLVATLTFPACALGGNAHPKLYLEVYHFEEDPVSLPQEICWHQWPLTSPLELPCYAPRVPYHVYYLPLHVGDLDLPTCPSTQGYLCAGYGGYKSVAFGVSQTPPTGHPLTFMSWNACPGFLKGPSAAGEPAACLASTTQICHSSHDHEGYLVYLNASTATDAVYFNIVDNADLGYAKVYSCSSSLDEGTTIGGGAQVGGSQTVVCGQMPVAELTWGKIKGLYR